MWLLESFRSAVTDYQRVSRFEPQNASRILLPWKVICGSSKISEAAADSGKVIAFDKAMLKIIFKAHYAEIGNTEIHLRFQGGHFAESGYVEAGRNYLTKSQRLERSDSSED